MRVCIYYMFHESDPYVYLKEFLLQVQEMNIPSVNFVLLLKGNVVLEDELLKFIFSLKNVKIYRIKNIGRDVHSYLSLPMADIDYIGFLNCYTRFNKNYKTLYSFLKSKDIEFYANFVSSRSHFDDLLSENKRYNVKTLIKILLYACLFKARPNYHFRTTGFIVKYSTWCEVARMFNLLKLSRSKLSAYFFESGRYGMSDFLLKKFKIVPETLAMHDLDNKALLIFKETEEVRILDKERFFKENRNGSN